jgi:hypothetical protein
LDIRLQRNAEIVDAAPPVDYVSRDCNGLEADLGRNLFGNRLMTAQMDVTAANPQ